MGEHRAPEESTQSTAARDEPLAASTHQAAAAAAAALAERHPGALALCCACCGATTTFGAAFAPLETSGVLGWLQVHTCGEQDVYEAGARLPWPERAYHPSKHGSDARGVHHCSACGRLGMTSPFGPTVMMSSGPTLRS